MLTALSIGIANPMFDPTWELKRPPPAAAVFMPMILALRVDERAAGVAGLDRRVDLDHALERLLRAGRVAGGHLLVERGHLTLRRLGRAALSERVADRDDRVADA